MCAEDQTSSLTREIKTVTLNQFRFPANPSSECDGQVKLSSADYDRLVTLRSVINRPVPPTRQPARQARLTQYGEYDGQRCVVTDAVPALGDVRRSVRCRKLIEHKFA